MPVPRMQFLDASGTPLAGGLVYTYNAGTSTPAPTYTDSTGTTLNSNPVVLDAGGEAQIWLADQSYRIAVANSSNVQQWMTDNVSAYQILQGAQNITLAGVTSDPPVAAGELGYRSDLARIRFANTAWDSIPGLATVDTFSNKTLDVTQNTIKTAANVAGHYLRNNAANYVDSAILAPDMPVFLPSGATHAQGIVPDPGASAGTTRFLREDATWQPVGGIGFAFEGTNAMPVTVANSTSLSPLQTITLAANELAPGRTIYFDAQGIVGATGTPSLSISVYLDSIFMGVLTMTLGVVNTQPWAARGWFTCTAAGVTGTITGAPMIFQSTPSITTNRVNSNTAGVANPPQSVVVDTTVSHVLQLQVLWGTADPLNTITSNVMTSYRTGI